MPKGILPFKKYQRECLVAAHDLCYPEAVFIAIRAAKTEAELSNIMVSALKDEYSSTVCKSEVMANG